MDVCVRACAFDHSTHYCTCKRPRKALTYEISKHSYSPTKRPCKPGEVVDYFVSHSWHDDPETKFKALNLFAERFRKVKKRFPTFWIDKVCIDQANISDGLRTLPVKIMACHRILALCGETYCSRLWCVWELYTSFAFQKDAAEVRKHET